MDDSESCYVQNSSTLGDYDREEWWDICRKIRPDMTREEFEADWVEFQALKARRKMQ